MSLSARRGLAVLWLVAALVPFVAGAASAEPSVYVWVEAEKPATSNFKTWTGGDRPDLLSDGKLLGGALDAAAQKAMPKEGFLLTYKLSAPEAGRYEAWARVGFEWIRAPFEWRIDDGDWHDAPADRQTTNVMELKDFNEIAWLDLGPVDLPKGASTFTVRFTKPGSNGQIMFMLDCFDFTRGHWVPEGKLKPGQSYDSDVDRQAAAQVYKLPAPAPDAARTEVTLTGLWQVARYDDPDMDVDTFVPVQQIPSPDDYPLRWMGIQVPSSLWDKDEMIYGQRCIYRTRVDVPAAYAGRGFKLHFSGTNLIASVFVNGRLAGTHRGVWIPWDLDVSRYVEPGKVNEIAVAIKGPYYAIDIANYGRAKDLDHTRNRPRDRQDWVYYVEPIYPSSKGDGNGVDYGIVCPVKLVAVGNAYTEDVFVKPGVDSRNNKELTTDVTVRNTGDAERTFDVKCEAVYDPDSKVREDLRPGQRDRSAGREQDGDRRRPVGQPEALVAEAGPGPLPPAHHRQRGRQAARRAGDAVRLPLGDHQGRRHLHQQRAPQLLELGRRARQSGGRRRVAEGLPRGQRPLHPLQPEPQDQPLPEDARGAAGLLRPQRHPRAALLDDRRHVHQSHARQPHHGPRHRPGLARPELAGVGGLRPPHGPAYARLPQPPLGHHVPGGERADLHHRHEHLRRLPRPHLRPDGQRRRGRRAPTTRRGPTPSAAPATCSAGWRSTPRTIPTGDMDWYPENAYALTKFAPKHQDNWPWMRKKPWVVGESAFANALEDASYVIGDRAFRSADDENRGKAAFLRMLYGGYRWAGVAGFFPWDNLHGYEDADKVFSDLYIVPRRQTSRLYAGQDNTILFKVMNDTLSKDPVHVEWTYEAGGKTVTKGSADMHIQPGFGEERPISIRAPQTDVRLDGTLTLKATQPGAPDYVDVRPVPVLPVVSALKVDVPVAVLDRSGKLADFLTKVGLKFDLIAKLDDVKGRQGLLLVGPDTFSAQEALGRDLLTFAAQGGRAVVLEQDVPAAGANLPAPVRTTTHYGGYAHPKALGTPVFKDLGADDLIDWAGGGPVYKNVYEKPTQGARNLAECGVLLPYAPLIEMPTGDGVIVVCQLTRRRQPRR